jgi:hypothetical protein
MGNGGIPPSRFFLLQTESGFLAMLGMTNQEWAFRLLGFGFRLCFPKFRSLEARAWF